MRVFNCLRCNADISHKKASARFCKSYCQQKYNPPPSADIKYWKLPEYKTKKAAYVKERYASNPDVKEAYRKRGRKNAQANPAQALFKSAKERAKKSGIEFSITSQDIHVPENRVCPVLGILMTIRAGDKSAFDTAMTLDRIDPSKGYIPGNICVISRKANFVKSYGTADDHLAIAAYMQSHLPTPPLPN